MSSSIQNVVKSGYAVVQIDLPDGTMVTIATPPAKIARFEAAIREIVGKNNPKKKNLSKKNFNRVSKTELYRKDDAVWTVTAFGFGASRNELDGKVDEDVLQQAIDDQLLVVDGVADDGSDWIRLPNAANLEAAIFDELLEEIGENEIYRSRAGAIIKGLYPDHYSQPFFEAIILAATDETDGVLDILEVEKSGHIYHTYVRRQQQE